jgi:hypothetical protein
MYVVSEKQIRKVNKQNTNESNKHVQGTENGLTLKSQKNGLTLQPRNVISVMRPSFSYARAHSNL